jgi:hypothetical protein
MFPEQYVWLFWSLLFLVPWGILYAVFPAQRRGMLWASLFTAPFALTEPLFVPKYWDPPSLFSLAQTTRFDIESFFFCFGIGGVASVLYNVLTGRARIPLAPRPKGMHLARYHYVSVASPFIAFLLLLWVPWNPIYPCIIAMFVGAIATMLCRPDLARKTWIGGLLFVLYYLVFIIGLHLSQPGYIERVWRLSELSGILVWGLPIEELLFAAGFGLYWSGVYEHLTWRRQAVESAGVEPSLEAAD